MKIFVMKKCIIKSLCKRQSFLPVIDNSVPIILHDVYHVNFPRHREQWKIQFVTKGYYFFGNLLNIMAVVYYQARCVLLDQFVDKHAQIFTGIFWIVSAC